MRRDEKFTLPQYKARRQSAINIGVIFYILHAETTLALRSVFRRSANESALRKGLRRLVAKPRYFAGTSDHRADRARRPAKSRGRAYRAFPAARGNRLAPAKQGGLQWFAQATRQAEGRNHVLPP